MQPSVRQSQIVLSIRVLERNDSAADMPPGWDCRPIDIADTGGVVCERDTGDSGGVMRRYVIRNAVNAVEISVDGSRLGQPFIPLVEEIIQSLEIS